MGLSDAFLVMRGATNIPAGVTNPYLLSAAPTGNLTATETGPVLDTLGNAATSYLPGGSGTPLHQPLILAVIVPNGFPTGSATPAAVVKLQHSDDNTNWEDFLFVPESAVAGGIVGQGMSATPGQIVAAGEYRIAFATKRRYMRYVATISGTTPNFGVTVIRIEISF